MSEIKSVYTCTKCGLSLAPHFTCLNCDEKEVDDFNEELARLRKIEAAAKVVIAYSGGCDDELLYDALPYLAEALEEGETE